MEDPLDSILIVGCSEDLLYHQLPRPGNDGGLVTEIGVFEKNAVILFVDTNRILDFPDASVLGGEVGVQIMDSSFAIAAKGKTVRHIASAIFSQVKGVFPLVRVFRVTAIIIVSLDLHV